MEHDRAIKELNNIEEGVACSVFERQARETYPLYRAYNNTIDDHLYTTNEVAGKVSPPPGYCADGTACYVYRDQKPSALPLERMFNQITGDHFYTKDLDEAFDAINRDENPYRSEGDACYVPISPLYMTPFFRLFDPKTGDHLYTTSLEEVIKINATAGVNRLIYYPEGINTNYWQRLACYVYTSEAYPDYEYASPLYRLYNPHAHDHFYTTDWQEYQTLRTDPASAWNDEHIACWVSSIQYDWLTPFHRLFKP